MRFPDISFMQRVFDLFTYVGLTKGPSGQANIIPYIMSIDGNLNFYNGTILTNAELAQSTDPYPFKTGVGLTKTVDAYVAQVLGPFKDKLKADFPTGWEYMMQFDEYSTRDYMAFGLTPSLTDPVRLISIVILSHWLIPFLGDQCHGNIRLCDELVRLCFVRKRHGLAGL